MADIRIKDLATTAASSASDDYVAIDGASNGTRKLSAYSPTFGGNLTVSGTGTSTFASHLTLNGSKILTVNGSGNLVQIGDASGTVAILLNRLNTSSNSNFYWLTAGALKWAVGVGINAVGEDFEFYSYPAGNTLLKLGSTTGNLLIGTTTDTGQKLQVAGTAYVSGDATFAANVTASGQIKSTYTADYGIYAAPSGGANRNIAIFGVSGATNGMTVKWDHASTTMRVNIANLPTSATGLAAGDLYNSAGTLKVA